MGTPPPSPPVVNISCPGWGPIGSQGLFTATTDVSCSIAIYFDGNLVNSGSGTSLSFTAGAGTSGHHIIRVIASIGGVSSEAICNWNAGIPVGMDSLWYYQNTFCIQMGTTDVAILETIALGAVGLALPEALVAAEICDAVTASRLATGVTTAAGVWLVANDTQPVTLCIPQSVISTIPAAASDPSIHLPITLNGTNVFNVTLPVLP